MRSKFLKRRSTFECLSEGGGNKSTRRGERAPQKKIRGAAQCVFADL